MGNVDFGKIHSHNYLEPRRTRACGQAFDVSTFPDLRETQEKIEWDQFCNAQIFFWGRFPQGPVAGERTWVGNVRLFCTVSRLFAPLVFFRSLFKTIPTGYLSAKYAPTSLVGLLAEIPMRTSIKRFPALNIPKSHLAVRVSRLFGAQFSGANDR